MKIMKNERASIENKLTMDVLKGAGNAAVEVLAELFNMCITLCDVP